MGSYRIGGGDGPQPKDWFLYKKKEMWTWNPGREPCEETEAEMKRDCYQPRSTPGGRHPRTPDTASDEPTLRAPRSGFSGLQNCKRMNSCCVTSRAVWSIFYSSPRKPIQGPRPQAKPTSVFDNRGMGKRP